MTLRALSGCRLLTVALVGAALIGCLTTACTTGPTVETDPFKAAEGQDLGETGRPYVVFETKRYLSGPYGEPDAIQEIIGGLKRHGTSRLVSARALGFPNTPANLSFRIHALQFPDQCGAHQFHVYEGDQFLILEYHQLRRDDELVQIRDYVRGPNPFVAAGLWGPYDHTSDGKLDMCLLPGSSSSDGLGLMKGGYEVGWVTTLAKWKQVELGVDYRRAVGETSRCVSRLDSGEFAHLYQREPGDDTRRGNSGVTYTVRAGDSLSGIAEKVYGDPRRWRAIYDRNTAKIGLDPHALPAGITLDIP